MDHDASHLFVNPFCYKGDKNVPSDGEKCGKNVAAKETMTQQEQDSWSNENKPEFD